MSVVKDFEALQDRLDISDVLYRYASCIDRRNLAGVRATLADDIWAQYGNAEPMEGGDTVTAWIDAATADCIWQHHLLSVYHVDLNGDVADALVYHTSYQMMSSDSGLVNVLVARYHNQLKRTEDGWRISRLVFEILWGEQRRDTTGFLDSVGGRGPAVAPGVL
jgi:ketosteroid isomerase-like protein